MAKNRRYLSGSVRVGADGRWRARIRLPTGVDTTRILGPAWRGRGATPEGYLTERDAGRMLDDILRPYEGYTTGSNPLLRDAADEFLEDCRSRGLSANTVGRYEGIVEHDLKPTLGHRPLASIEEDDVIELRDALSDRGLSASSMNQAKIVLAGIVRRARKAPRRYRGDDFSGWFEPSQVPVKLELDVYEPTEVEQLARALAAGLHRDEETKRRLSVDELAERERMNRQDAAAVRTSSYAGLRLSEIRGLRWSDVDFAGAKIFVHSGYTDRGGMGKPKNRKARTVPMAPQVAAELDGLSRREHFTAADDLVFCNALGGTVSGSALYRRVTKAMRAAGLRRLRYHDLRHCAACMLIQIFPISDVKEMMGHASITTTMRYLHYVPRTDSASRIGDFIESGLGARIGPDAGVVVSPRVI